ncbi:IPExxxVDY family protein [Flavobacterium sp. TP390]|uniref:IPExxxVDY family protein n=1 Tax=Flavobacterium profundi TaxID=1774945 RepID=A0A6I4IM42_9FLAO|nr:IPExxxVDY family protein [Flavobacterium profundi]MVO09672.1 IPExxxVDY family protein [Flavobacterium profundi]
MAIHKIQINDFISIDYELIAIHSSLEDYRLAYFINKALQIQLSKSNSNIEIETKEGKSEFSHFIFDDEVNDIIWNVFENKATAIPSEKTTNGIFDSVDVTMYVVPEFKKADYILKIENMETVIFPLERIIQKLSKISQISMVYRIDQNKLKSKNNLIF